MLRGQTITTSARCSILALAVATGIFGSPQPAASKLAASVSALSGTSWQLVGIQTTTDSMTAPDDGTKYTLTFAADKRAMIRADCNRGVASWHSTDDDLSFGALKMTRVRCAEKSMHKRFINDLAYVRWYTFEDGKLYLSLRGNGGTLEFAPMAQ